MKNCRQLYFDFRMKNCTGKLAEFQAMSKMFSMCISMELMRKKNSDTFTPVYPVECAHTHTHTCTCMHTQRAQGHQDFKEVFGLLYRYCVKWGSIYNPLRHYWKMVTIHSSQTYLVISVGEELSEVHILLQQQTQWSEAELAVSHV